MEHIKSDMPHFFHSPWILFLFLKDLECDGNRAGRCPGKFYTFGIGLAASHRELEVASAVNPAAFLVHYGESFCRD